jgi:hypothetical protein
MKSLALVGSTPAIFGAIEEGWAVRSLDGGKTWEQIVADIGMLAHDGHSIVVGSDGPDTVVVATGKGMFRSTDRGDHFEQVNKGLEERSYTSTPLASHPGRPGFLLSGVTAVGPGGWRRPEGGDSGIARSEDGGRTWQVSTKGLPSPCVGIPRGLGRARRHFAVLRWSHGRHDLGQRRLRPVLRAPARWPPASHQCRRCVVRKQIGSHLYRVLKNSDFRLIKKVVDARRTRN